MARLIRKAKQYGFTLVELLIVVAIIGVLATIGVPSFRRMVQKSKKSEAKVALGGLYTSEQAFFSEYGGFGNHLGRMGYNVDGNPTNLMYVTGFLAANCDSLVTSAATTLPPQAGSPIGAAVNQAFPQYFTGHNAGAYALRSIPAPAGGISIPGSSSVGNNILTVCTAAPAALAGVYGAGTPNNVSSVAGGDNNRFLAMAHGVIAPGVSKTAPAAIGVDIWGINQDRVTSNLQDGVQN